MKLSTYDIFRSKISLIISDDAYEISRSICDIDIMCSILSRINEQIYFKLNMELRSKHRFSYGINEIKLLK